MDAKGAKMLTRDYTPEARLAQHHKDVRLILDEARAAGVELPLSSVHDTLLGDAEALGFGDADNSAIIELFRHRRKRVKSLAERWPDLVILLAYMAAMVAIGVRFSRKQTNTETYFVAKRSVPSWAMGFSLVATLITSVTFVAYPGSAYAKNWSLLVPGLMVVGVLALVGAVIIPFYREAVGMSAYEYFGQRFGRGARMYASFAFCLAHFSKMGFIFYLLALTIRSLTGWDLNVIVLGVGVATIFYTLIGGLEAVIWSDVLQGFVLWVGVIICLGYLFFLPPAGLRRCSPWPGSTASSASAVRTSTCAIPRSSCSSSTASSGTCNVTRPTRPWCSATWWRRRIARPSRASPWAQGCAFPCGRCSC